MKEIIVIACLVYLASIIHAAILTGIDSLKNHSDKTDRTDIIVIFTPVLNTILILIYWYDIIKSKI